MSRADLFKQAEECHKKQDADGMCTAVKAIIQQGQPLSTEERGLFHIAYKIATGSRRGNLRKDPNDPALKRAVTDICGEVLDLLDKYLIPTHTDPESRIFLLKTKGDYHRYYAEVSPTQAEKDCAAGAYARATQEAEASLPLANPLRLNVALNYGVFEYEIMGNKQMGFDITKKAFDTAHPNMEKLSEDQFKEVAFVMELLRENILLWSKELGVDLGGK
eukprot:NODE_371_length_897_cov_1572.674026_g363_i0.p1 GENE.NODE_371_length_897_cov_1572.674026_g363_i0~~NODE_371_length_897_cov_1572.674026_g363_i0.p1  ORF type:complete len:219 (-),score=60.86 NODE_371_length_897_cov_1572.674026_g363_i0:170-826(-)